MTLFCIDLEVGAIWADGDLGLVRVEGEGGDRANVELIDMRSHFRMQPGRGGSPLSASVGKEWGQRWHYVCAVIT